MSTTLDSVQVPGSRLTAGDIAAFVDRLADTDVDGADDANIDELAALERLKSACSARQARVTHRFATSQLQAAVEAEREPDEVRRSIAAQIALARKDSPVRGNRHVGFAKAMVEEMPHTFQALQDGRISEWRATLLVRETACPSLEHRGVVDAELADRLGELGDKHTAGAAARIGQRLDPQAWVKRYRKAVSERRVSIRPAPDLMTYVTAFLPMAQGVAVYAALSRHVDCARATGDDRGRGQIMADEFVARATRSRSEAADDAQPDTRRANGPVPENVETTTTSESTASNVPAPHPEDADSSNDPKEAVEVETRTGSTTFGPVPATVSAPDADVAGRSEEGNVETRTRSTTFGPVAATASASNADVTGLSDEAVNDVGVETRARTTTSDPATDATDQGADINTRDATADAAHSDDLPTTATPPDGFTAGTTIDIQLIMTDRTLLDGDNEPAHVTGYGPIPAPLARRLLLDAGPNIKAWVRRLYADPDTKQLITGDSRSRFFTHSMRQFLIARDQTCRTPYCDAPIRHIDHIISRQHDGQTEITNGQGKCERCNYTKESPGWASSADPDNGTVTITTPTGHAYGSQPPPPPQTTEWQKAPATTGPPSPAARKSRTVVDIVFPEQRLRKRFEVVG